MTHFVGGVLQPFVRQEDFREDLIRLERRLAFGLALGSAEEFARRQRPRFAARPSQGELGAQRDEGGSQARGVDKERRTFVAENGVITVVSFPDQRGVPFPAQQTVAVAEIPAARTLAKVAANGARVENLRTADVLGGGQE